MTNLTETQSLILTAAARRPGRLALPLPNGLVGAAARMAVGRMTAHGWIEEVEANLRAGELLWRETSDGHGTTLIATEAGLEAIGTEPVVASAVADVRKVTVESGPEPAPTGDTAALIPGRTGTKLAQIIALLQRPQGASIAEMVAAAGWLPHSVRGMISGALKKKLGLPITSEKVKDRGTVHRIVSD